MAPPTLLLLAAPAQVVTGMGQPLPPAAEALLQAQDWPRLADWFDKAGPKVRRQYYEYWLQALNGAGRWAKLAEACRALTPQLEGKGGPRLGTPRLYRAQALSRLGKHREAMAAHAENGRLGHKDGYPNACAEARLAQDWKALLGYSEALLAKQPDHAEALAWKGEALARLGRFDASAGALKQAVAANPKDPAAWNNLGRAALQRKDWAEAREAFDRALALEPGQLEARFNRGIAHFNLKAYAASRDDFAAALALKPGDPLITSNLKQAERALALTAAAPKPALPDSNQAP